MYRIEAFSIYSHRLIVDLFLRKCWKELFVKLMTSNFVKNIMNSDFTFFYMNFCIFDFKNNQNIWYKSNIFKFFIVIFWKLKIWKILNVLLCLNLRFIIINYMFKNYLIWKSYLKIQLILIVFYNSIKKYA